MNKRTWSLFLTGGAACKMAIAQQSQAPAKFGQAMPTPLAEAIVRKVDARLGLVMLEHGEIRQLNMPPMTMSFEAGDKALLAPLRAGDRIRFAATAEKGRYFITRIETDRKSIRPNTDQP